jgi:hypothetical protein
MNSPSLSESDSIRVAGYLTELPPREVLAQKLKSAVAIARERLAARTGGKIREGANRTEANDREG